MFCVLILASCATLKVNYYGKKVDKIQNITLLSTMIGKIQQPVFPLIDAAAFNGKTNSIADQIMDLQKKNIDNYREIIASSLKKNFNCEVIYGNSLQEKPEFIEIKEKFNFPNALRIENDNYPMIIVSSNDINPFKYEKGKVVPFFKEPSNYKNVISEICKINNSNLLAVSYSTLTVTGAGMFGAWGFLRLDTYLYLFDRDGDLISDSQTWSKQSKISGKDIEQYKSQLDNLSIILEPMMSKVIVNYQTK